MGRSGGFLYGKFVQDKLDELNGESASKTSLYRSALESGASERKSETVVKKLSESLNTIGNRVGYQRHKLEGRTGYYFRKRV